MEANAPELSIVVVIVSDTTGTRRQAAPLAACLQALSAQVDAPSLEIIVPYLPPVEGLEDVKRRFPGVVWLPVERLETYTGQGGSREHHDELRARGLSVARGEIVGLLEDHARPDARWSRSVADAHAGAFQDYAAIGGAIENDIDRALNWAVYFCDFGKYENPVPAGPSPFASDANIAYKRAALEAIRPVWEKIFHETLVNRALVERGDKLGLSPDIVVYQRRSGLTLRDALKERYIWGRSYAATRTRVSGEGKRWMYAALAPALPLLLVARMTANAFKKKRRLGAFLRALPLTVLLTAAWAVGEMAGYLTARPGRSTDLAPADALP